MPLHQESAPLFEALQEYARKAPAIFHVPGHKQGRWAPADWAQVIGTQALGIDLTEAPGLDDLHAPEGVIAQAQELAAAAFGAASSHFLVGGTTAGLHALLLAACQPGDTVLVPRHAHRSILGGLILAGLVPAWIEPEYADGLDIALGVSPSAVRQALAANPGARALVLVHPTFYGVASSISEVVQAAHAAGVMVLTDEAHAAHFAFAPSMPEPALQVGVAGTVQSLHKTGGSLTQSAICHVAHGSRLSPSRLQEALRLVQTTSPSYLLMASLDVARRHLVQQGAAEWSIAVEMAERLRERLGALVFPTPPSYTQDPTKLVIDTRPLGLTGFAAANQLWEQQIAVESAGYGFLLAVMTPGDHMATIERLERALKGLRPEGPKPGYLGPPPVSEAVQSPRDAYLGPKVSIALKDALGRIAAEMVAPYPPGIPVLVPGEKITGDTLEYLGKAVQTGHHLQGPVDACLRTIQVVKE